MTRIHWSERRPDALWNNCPMIDYQGQIYGVTVTATTIEGKHIRFDIAVDNKPTNRHA